MVGEDPGMVGGDPGMVGERSPKDRGMARTDPTMTGRSGHGRGKIRGAMGDTLTSPQQRAAFSPSYHPERHVPTKLPCVFGEWSGVGGYPTESGSVSSSGSIVSSTR